MSDLPRISRYGSVRIGDLTFNGAVLDGRCVKFATADSSDGFGFVFQRFNGIHESFKINRDRFFNFLSAARSLGPSEISEVDGLCYVPFCTLTHLIDLLTYQQDGDCFDVSASAVQSAKALLLMQFLRLPSIYRKNKEEIQLNIFDDNASEKQKKKKATLAPTSCVYFLEADNLIKIGVTGNVKSRVSSLQTGCPSEVKLIKTVRGGPATEKRIHARFNHLRVRGEWFEKTEELISYIERLEATVF